MKILDGKLVSQTIRDEIKAKTAELAAKGIVPGLATVLVGDDPASDIYVTNKVKACTEVGFTSREIRLPASTTEAELLTLIDELNRDDAFDGILVQLPVPKQIDDKKIINAISPEKDVDGFHPVNVGKLSLGEDGFVSCTPLGITKILDFYGIDVAGRSAVVIGRSNIVGKPMAMLLVGRSATVTVCHSKTRDLPAVVRQADIVIAAIGKAKFVTADMVKDGAVVIDVGMNRPEGGKLCGDVDFDEVSKKASAITPVPGGVGPMTITMLLFNTLKSAAKRSQRGR